MLGVLCARPKSWILNSHAHGVHGCFSAAAGAAHFHGRKFLPLQQQHFPGFFVGSDRSRQQRHHSSVCSLAAAAGGVGGAAAWIWRVIQPTGCCSRTRRGSGNGGGGYVRRLVEPRGEGSWNVAWDARPARWLHRLDSAWLLIGVCAGLAPIDFWKDASPETAADGEKAIDGEDLIGNVSADVVNHGSAPYKVTGVLADGRCLFRAIAHGACLRNGEAPPDENRERELADELRAQVVDELLKRREEIELFVEEDFDSYVKRIQHPYVWGGEPELLMASHVLKTMISVYSIDRTSGKLVKIANYGVEYGEDQVNPINVLFHGYGHYDILETISDQSYQKVNV